MVGNADANNEINLFFTLINECYTTTLIMRKKLHEVRFFKKS